MRKVFAITLGIAFTPVRGIPFGFSPERSASNGANQMPLLCNPVFKVFRGRYFVLNEAADGRRFACHNRAACS
jgi:hypothetical protein